MKNRPLAKVLIKSIQVFSLKWEVGDFAIWNNREILHSGTLWHIYENDQRLMHIFFLDSTEKFTPASQLY
ncbi:TauD/TfdA family dioxygenase [Dapis sp. BLCC M126]|uniref:TauD/TfdA family dioxygenase n=1 Tax=Dapis sp. BLCC M126 TaxID=3400189 RepID=UPI003CFA84B9